jgi:hypothetical protein
MLAVKGWGGVTPARRWSLSIPMFGLAYLNGSLLTIAHSIHVIRANETFRNVFFTIANQFAFDELLEGANKLRGVPA